MKNSSKQAKYPELDLGAIVRQIKAATKINSKYVTISATEHGGTVKIKVGKHEIVHNLDTVQFGIFESLLEKDV